MGQFKLKFLLLTIILTAMVSPVQAQQLPRVAAPPAEQITPHPRLVVAANRHDFGLIAPGTTVSHIFLVENKGQSPLDILEVRPGCGCGDTKFDAQIAPGETGRISLSIQVYQEWAGQKIRKSAWVLTNDPLAPQFRLILTGQVESLDDQDTSPVVPDTPNGPVESLGDQDIPSVVLDSQIELMESLDDQGISLVAPDTPSGPGESLGDQGIPSVVPDSQTENPGTLNDQSLFFSAPNSPESGDQ